MHVCLLSRVEVTYLEGLTNPVPLKPLALNSTETAKNHILKKTKKKHVLFFFFFFKGEKAEVCEVGSFHPHSSMSESFGVTRGSPSFSSSSCHQNSVCFSSGLGFYSIGPFHIHSSVTPWGSSTIPLHTLQPGTQEGGVNSYVSALSLLGRHVDNFFCCYNTFIPVPVLKKLM